MSTIVCDHMGGRSIWYKGLYLYRLKGLAHATHHDGLFTYKRGHTAIQRLEWETRLTINTSYHTQIWNEY